MDDTSKIREGIAKSQGIDPENIVEIRYKAGEKPEVLHTGDDQSQKDKQKALDAAGKRVDGSPESVLKHQVTSYGKTQEDHTGKNVDV